MAQEKNSIKCVNNCIWNTNWCFWIPACRSHCLMSSCSGYHLIKCYFLSDLGTIVPEKQKIHLKAHLGTFSMLLSGKDEFTHSFWNKIVLYKNTVSIIEDSSPAPCPCPQSLLFPSIPLPSPRTWDGKSIICRLGQQHGDFDKSW